MTKEEIPGEPAIAEWRALLGERWVTSKREGCAPLERATFRTSGRVVAHLVPGTVEELVECVRIANRYRQRVNVFSRGRNYGYASCSPAKGSGVTIELSRLDSISEFDEELGVVRVQAGVTFGQLARYLSERGSRRYLPATGGPLDGSVLANMAERGHGLGLGGDRYAHSCRYEIVTPEGKRFETGFGRFEGSRIANLMRSGVGPSLDGLFTQSSLGIVVSATFWLPRRPRYHSALLVTSPARDRIAALFDCVGEGARQGLLRDGCCFAMGEFKLATIQTRREDYGPPDAPLGWGDLRRHSRRWGRASWLLAAHLEADTRALLRAKERALMGIFAGRGERGERRILLTAARARFARWLAPILPLPVRAAVQSIVDVFYERTPLLGYPIEQSLETTYWALPRGRESKEHDLHADQVGLIWVSVPVPLRGDEVEAVCRIIDDGLLQYGFEPSTQVTLVSERLARVITALSYDRTRVELDERALECQRAVYATLKSRGYYTYRLQPHLMDEYAAEGATHQEIGARIKDALDPKGILDPSRYPFVPSPVLDDPDS